jgi:NADPH-ferrihemoprotein reductase
MATALEPTQKHPVWCAVVENRELLPSNPDGRSTRHIVFDINDTLVTYQAGDHLGVLPCNSDQVIDDYLKILRVSDEMRETVFSLQDKSLKNVFSARVTVRDALKWYIDLSGVPKKSTLRAFAHYCTNPAEKDDLLATLRATTEAQEKYHKLLSKLRTVFGFLRKYSSCEVPIAIFLELMPRMCPRYFSIASDQLVQTKQIFVTVALVAGGVCTTMLKDASVGSRFPIFVRKSNFHLPLRAKNRPLIMVGPGTGVAPLLGFLHRRAAWKAKNNELGEAILFFGCRKEQEDYIYRDFLKSSVADGVISDLDVAFSRDQKEKVYVQHRIQKRAADVWRIISSGGNVYLCGDAKHMAKDVEAELLETIREHGKMGAADAAAYLDAMAKGERYLKDVWSA